MNRFALLFLCCTLFLYGCGGGSDGGGTSGGSGEIQPLNSKTIVGNWSFKEKAKQNDMTLYEGTASFRGDGKGTASTSYAYLPPAQNPAPFTWNLSSDGYLRMTGNYGSTTGKVSGNSQKFTMDGPYSKANFNRI